MSNLLFYILSTSICLTLFVLAYQIFLRNNTRFKLCRFYLISAILMSFLIPSIPIDIGISLIHKTEQKTTSIEVEPIALSSSRGTVTSTPVESGFNLNIDYLAIIGISFLSISLLLFIRFIYRFGSIILIQTSGNRVENEEGFNLILTDRTDNAFSFLGSIFINPLKFNDEEKRLIIEHEREHIRHFHSIDLIIIELLIVLQWFNPFAYIARRKLIEVHEFIADNGVIRKGADPYSYQTLLLSVVTSSCLPSAGNQLSALITKKRIAMIGKPLNQTGRWINFLILVPTAAILVIGISAFTVNESKNIDTKKEIVIHETQPFTLLKITDSKIINPIVIENKNNSTLQIESESSRFEEFDFKPISRKGVETLKQNQNPVKVEKLNIALKEKGVYQSIKDELLKRAMVESKDKFLKDLYFSLPPNGTSSDVSPMGYTTRYSVILKKNCIYSLNYLSGSKNDNLEAVISIATENESVIDKQFKFSYSNKITLKPKLTSAYHLEIRNLSSRPAEALILLNIVGESTIPTVYESEKNNSISNTNEDSTEVFQVVEQMPSFGSGDANEFRTWVAANMKYPKEAAEKGIQGRVFVQFVVKADGSLKDIKILGGVDPALDKEALRVIESSPKWNPGKQKGEPVSVSYTFPITFTLGNTNNPSTAEAITSQRDNVAGEEVFLVVERMPTFGSGDAGEFRTWVASNMQYPKEAAEKGLQGRVFVQFVIEKDGTLTNVKVIQGVDAILDKEAVRIVESSPKWNPGKQRGESVRVSYTFPITFLLQ